MRPVLTETVAVLVGGSTRCWVFLGEDRSADRAAVALQYDVVC